jgi:hypothetical protein
VFEKAVSLVTEFKYFWQDANLQADMGLKFFLEALAEILAPNQD